MNTIVTKAVNPGLSVTSWTTIESPWGMLLLCGNHHGVSSLDFPQQVDERLAELGSDHHDAASLRVAIQQLKEYFSHRRTVFQMPLSLEGTPFQRRVWQELQEIPYGTTISYRELATRVGKPRASRAVGSANGRNRIPIIIPCHRVIAADGGLGGFGGGLELKRDFLRHEGIEI